MKPKTTIIDKNLTNNEAAAYSFIKDQNELCLTVSRSDIQGAMGFQSKSWTCKIIKKLIQKKMIERYEQRYYKLKS